MAEDISGVSWGRPRSNSRLIKADDNNADDWSTA